MSTFGAPRAATNRYSALYAVPRWSEGALLLLALGAGGVGVLFHPWPWAAPFAIGVVAALAGVGHVDVAEDGLVLGTAFWRHFVPWREVSVVSAQWPRVVLQAGDAVWVVSWGGGPGSSFDAFVARLRDGAYEESPW